MRVFSYWQGASERKRMGRLMNAEISRVRTRVMIRVIRVSRAAVLLQTLATVTGLLLRTWHGHAARTETRPAQRPRAPSTMADCLKERLTESSIRSSMVKAVPTQETS